MIFDLFSLHSSSFLFSSKTSITSLKHITITSKSEKSFLCLLKSHVTLSEASVVCTYQVMDFTFCPLFSDDNFIDKSWQVRCNDMSIKSRSHVLRPLPFCLPGCRSSLPAVAANWLAPGFLDLTLCLSPRLHTRPSPCFVCLIFSKKKEMQLMPRVHIWCTVSFHCTLDMEEWH